VFLFHIQEKNCSKKGCIFFKYVTAQYWHSYFKSWGPKAEN